jgi:hypothetical protein
MAVTLSELSSFTYEDLISKVETIQNQMFECKKILTNQWNDTNRKGDELKSRSLIFIDPYGNQTVNKHMDHELIGNIFNKYKKDYIPKYLQRWIQIGMMKENTILPLNDYELQSNVSHYTNDCEFVTFGEIIISINTEKTFHLEQFSLPVLLMDNMEQIKLKIKDHLQISDMEIQLSNISKNTNTNELKSDETIFSCQLYENDSILIAKVITKKVRF